MIDAIFDFYFGESVRMNKKAAEKEKNAARRQARRRNENTGID